MREAVVALLCNRIAVLGDGLESVVRFVKIRFSDCLVVASLKIGIYVVVFVCSIFLHINFEFILLKAYLKL